jgi:hypothetical protein
MRGEATVAGRSVWVSLGISPMPPGGSARPRSPPRQRSAPRVVHRARARRSAPRKATATPRRPRPRPPAWRRRTGAPPTRPGSWRPSHPPPVVLRATDVRQPPMSGTCCCGVPDAAPASRRRTVSCTPSGFRQPRSRRPCTRRARQTRCSPESACRARHPARRARGRCGVLLDACNTAGARDGGDGVAAGEYPAGPRKPNALARPNRESAPQIEQASWRDLHRNVSEAADSVGAGLSDFVDPFEVRREWESAGPDSGREASEPTANIRHVGAVVW